MVSTMKTKLRSHYHCVYQIQNHLVLVTKYRNKCFTNAILSRLEEISKSICKRWDFELLEFGGELDHVHLLISMHPNATYSKFNNNLKTVTSRLIRKEFTDHLVNFYWKPVLWSRSYCFISSGGAPLEIIKKYIEKQERPKG